MNLTKKHHLMWATYNDEERDVEDIKGIIYIQNNSYYFLSNCKNLDGSQPEDIVVVGFKYSWYISRFDSHITIISKKPKLKAFNKKITPYEYLIHNGSFCSDGRDLIIIEALKYKLKSKFEKILNSITEKEAIEIATSCHRASYLPKKFKGLVIDVKE